MGIREAKEILKLIRENIGTPIPEVTRTGLAITALTAGIEALEYVEEMGNKYTVVGDFRQPHRDCEGETLTDLSFEEVMKIESEWKKEKKYKEVFHFKQD